ncbi:MAG: PAS domain S-box protein, partial [Deltaproteobacteria bacterium]|nr:PAS domain S-box protein [Deltaproteobacteria bacterium]
MKLSRRMTQFLFTSFAGIVVVVVVLVSFYRELSLKSMMHHYDEHNAVLARILSNSLGHHGLDLVLGVVDASELDQPQDDSKGEAKGEPQDEAAHVHDDSHEHPAPTRKRTFGLPPEPLKESEKKRAEFRQRLTEHLEGLPIYSVTFYDQEGVVAYATISEILGDKVGKNKGFKQALEGESAGEIVWKDPSNPIGLHGVVQNRDFYVSYIPIRDTDSSPVKGVLEVRSDVSDLLMMMRLTERKIAAGVTGILGLFYVILFVLHFKTDRDLQREEAETQLHLREIKEAKEGLEERVAERTQELESHKVFLQSVIDGVADPVMVIDLDFQVKLMNEASLALMPKDPELGNHICCYELSHRASEPCSGEDHPCPFKEVVDTGKVCTVTHSHRQANGDRMIVEVTASPLQNLQGEIIGIVQAEHDITSLVESTDKLRESEQRFRDVADAVGEYVWELDKEDRFVFVTARVREVLGYSPTDLIGKTPADFMPEEEKTRVREFFTGREAQRAFRDLEHTCITRDGSLVWVSVSSVPTFDEQGEVIGSRGVAQDITDRKLVDMALQKSEAHMRAVMDNVVDGILTLDESGNIESLNRAAESVFGIYAERSKGSPLSTFIPELDALRRSGPSGISSKAPGDVVQIGEWETLGRKKNGFSFPIDIWLGELVLDEQEKMIAVV